MNAQIKIVAAIALILGGALWFWSRPDDARSARSPVSKPAPPASAARTTRKVPKPQLEAPSTAAQLEAAQRAEREAAQREQEPQTTAVPMGKKKRAPAPTQVEDYVPPPPLPPRMAEPGHIAGTVVDENGHPIQARTMLVGGEGGSFGGGNSGTDGAFDIERKGYETFQIKAWTRDGRVGMFSQSDFDATLGVSDVTIRLEKGATLKLTLEGELESCRVALFTDNVRHSDFTLRKGEVATEVVPAGSTYVELYSGGGEDKVVYDSQTVGLSPGQTEELVFTVNP